MKGYCFLILAVAFLMYFQKEPVFTVTILAIGIGMYFFIKARKSGKGLFSFMGGNMDPQQDRMNDIITLLMLQQLISDTPKNQPPPSVQKRQEVPTEPIEKEIMALFEKYDNNKVETQNNRKQHKLREPLS